MSTQPRSIPAVHRSCRLVLGVLLWACAMGGPSGAHAQQTAGAYRDERVIPKTAAYARALEVLEAVNSEDEEVVRALVSGAFNEAFRGIAPMEDHIEMFRDVRGVNGGLEAYAARVYSTPRPATNAVLICRGRVSELWRAIVVDVEPEPPYLIAGIGFAPARPPSDLPPAARLSGKEIAAELGAYVDRLAAADAFSGAVLVAKDGEVLLAKATGIANRDFDVPMRLDTKMNLGSMNKMMTGVAMMQLVERGKVSLDDPISKYLDDSWLPNVDKSSIKVVNLLTHTSGLGSYFTPAWDERSRALYRTVDDWKPLLASETLAFEPGTRWQYSNSGMLVAGAVIEAASGTDYFAFVRENITGPAGMTNTDCYELDLVNKNLAVGYEKVTINGVPTYRNNIFQHVMRGGPAGGGYSTVEDLLRFDRALRTEKLLSARSLDALWKAYPEIGSEEYGIGFGINASPGGRVVGHSGGFNGISGDLAMYLDDGWTIAVLSNYGGAARLVSDKGRSLIAQGR